MERPPMTLVSWRSHRVVASASAAEAMGLSGAIGQGDWMCEHCGVKWYWV